MGLLFLYTTTLLFLYVFIHFYRKRPGDWCEVATSLSFQACVLALMYASFASVAGLIYIILQCSGGYHKGILYFLVVPYVFVTHSIMFLPVHSSKVLEAISYVVGYRSSVSDVFIVPVLSPLFSSLFHPNVCFRVMFFFSFLFRIIRNAFSLQKMWTKTRGILRGHIVALSLVVVDSLKWCFERFQKREAQNRRSNTLNVIDAIGMALSSLITLYSQFIKDSHQSNKLKSLARDVRTLFSMPNIPSAIESVTNQFLDLLGLGQQKGLFTPSQANYDEGMNKTFIQVGNELFTGFLSLETESLEENGEDVTPMERQPQMNTFNLPGVCQHHFNKNSILGCVEAFEKCQSGLVHQVTAQTGAGKSTVIPEMLSRKTKSDVYLVVPTISAAESVSKVIHDRFHHLPHVRAGGKSQTGNTNIRIYTSQAFAALCIFNPRILLTSSAFVFDEMHVPSAENYLFRKLSPYIARRAIVVWSSATYSNSLSFDSELVHPVKDVFDSSITIENLFSDRIGPDQLRGSRLFGRYLVFVATKRETIQLSEKMRKKGIKSMGVNSENVKESIVTLRRMMGDVSNSTIVVFATNCMETGVTLPFNYVVDLGEKIQTVQVDSPPSIVTKRVKITKGEHLQRRGRIGRVGPGTYFSPNIEYSEPLEVDASMWATAYVYTKMFSLEPPPITFPEYVTEKKLTDNLIRNLFATSLSPWILFAITTPEGRIYKTYKDMPIPERTDLSKVIFSDHLMPISAAKGYHTYEVGNWEFDFKGEIGVKSGTTAYAPFFDYTKPKEWQLQAWVRCVGLKEPKSHNDPEYNESEHMKDNYYKSTSIVTELLSNRIPQMEQFPIVQAPPNPRAEFNRLMLDPNPEDLVNAMAWYDVYLTGLTDNGFTMHVHQLIKRQGDWLIQNAYRLVDETGDRFFQEFDPKLRVEMSRTTNAFVQRRPRATRQDILNEFGLNVLIYPNQDFHAWSEGERRSYFITLLRQFSTLLFLSHWSCPFRTHVCAHVHVDGIICQNFKRMSRAVFLCHDGFERYKTTFQIEEEFLEMRPQNTTSVSQMILENVTQSARLNSDSSEIFEPCNVCHSFTCSCNDEATNTEIVLFLLLTTCALLFASYCVINFVQSQMVKFSQSREKRKTETWDDDIDFVEQQVDAIRNSQRSRKDRKVMVEELRQLDEKVLAELNSKNFTTGTWADEDDDWNDFDDKYAETYNQKEKPRVAVVTSSIITQPHDVGKIVIHVPPQQQHDLWRQIPFNDKDVITLSWTIGGHAFAATNSMQEALLGVRRPETVLPIREPRHSQTESSLNVLSLRVNETTRPLGYGLICSNFIATNAHAVKDLSQGFITDGFNGRVMHNMQVLFQEGDLVLLKPAPSFMRPDRPYSIRSPEVGEKVVLLKPKKGTGIAWEFDVSNESTIQPDSTGLWSYYISTKAGDCGSPVIAIRDGSLIGFHSHGGKIHENCNFFQPFTFNVIQFMKKRIPQNKQMSPISAGHSYSHEELNSTARILPERQSLKKVEQYQPSKFLSPKIMQDGSFHYLGSFPEYTNFRSKLFRDMTFTSWIESEKSSWKSSLSLYAPSIMSSSAYYKDLLKYSRILPVYPDNYVSKSVEIFLNLHGDFFSNPGVMSAHEIQQIHDWSKSAGPRLNMTKREALGNLSLHEFEKCVRECEKLYLRQSSDFVPPIWHCALKDELRPIEKTHAMKTRTFCAGPIECVLGTSRVVNYFNSRMKERMLEIPSTYGINKFNRGWDELARHMMKEDNLYFSADVSRWDSTFDPPMFSVVVELRKKLCPVKYHPILDNLYSEILNTPLAIESGDVVQKKTGNDSGQPSTTSDNTIGLSSKIYYVLWEHYGEEKFYQLIASRDIVFVCNGDDSLFSVSKRLVSEGLLNVMSKRFLELGTTIVFTQPQPDLQGVEYMSHTFHKVEVDGQSLFVGILKKERILASMQYGREMDHKGKIARYTSCLIHSIFYMDLFLLIREYLEHWMIEEGILSHEESTIPKFLLTTQGVSAILQLYFTNKKQVNVSSTRALLMTCQNNGWIPQMNSATLEDEVVGQEVDLSLFNPGDLNVSFRSQEGGVQLLTETPQSIQHMITTPRVNTLISRMLNKAIIKPQNTRVSDRLATPMEVDETWAGLASVFGVTNEDQMAQLMGDLMMIAGDNSTSIRGPGRVQVTANGVTKHLYELWAYFVPGYRAFWRSQADYMREYIIMHPDYFPNWGRLRGCTMKFRKIAFDFAEECTGLTREEKLVIQQMKDSATSASVFNLMDPDMKAVGSGSGTKAQAIVGGSFQDTRGSSGGGGMYAL